ncbi:MAG: ArsR/SmtB family transcription factor [Ferrimicrobium sp.]|uniref:ArsR/SmtB family transcription factor n=1 Tax=Ferrimicrobium acidiphilum TaxID=121039 RepID=A0ABV3Y4N1_9ACTN|nr:metalloregulator ArsR/SmtB family transcription factor [Ferrimicrobium sp.]
MAKDLIGDNDMKDLDAKRAIFDAFAEIATALSAGRRLEIIDVLAQGERSVDAIAIEIGQSRANTSHHLQVLHQAGLVDTRRAGTHIYYRLANQQVETLFGDLRTLTALTQANFDQLTSIYLGAVHEREIIEQDELDRDLQVGNVTILDVRPRPEYRAGHIPGARSLPLAELSNDLITLSPAALVVTYCRGPYCSFSPTAVRILRAAGFDARRLRDGFPEWRRSGRPVATGDAPEHARYPPLT